MGCSAAIIFTVFGASYGTAKSAGAIFSSGIIRPDRLMQNTYDHAPLFPPLPRFHLTHNTYTRTYVRHMMFPPPLWPFPT